MKNRKLIFYFRGYALILMLIVIALSTGAQIQLSKPHGEKPLPNPLIVTSPRDEALAVTKRMLESREIPIDKEDCNAQNGDCTLITKGVVFIKGITTRSQLMHYCDVPDAQIRNWVRGRYFLRIQINPASPNSSQVGISAKFEGLTEEVVGSEWVTLNSKGELEDKLLRCLNERLHGGECKDEAH